MLSEQIPGCLLATGSGGSLKGTVNLAPYVAAKHWLVGMVRTARELGAAWCPS